MYGVTFFPTNFILITIPFLIILMNSTKRIKENSMVSWILFTLIIGLLS